MWWDPQATLVALMLAPPSLSKLLTSSGAVDLLKFRSSMPSCPSRLLPKVKMWPSCVTNALWEAPQATDCISTSKLRLLGKFKVLLWLL